MTRLSHNLLSRSILPRSEPGIEPEVVANTVSEDVQELLHPDDVAAIQAAYVVLPRSKHRLKLTPFGRWAKVCEEDEYLKAYQWYVSPQPSAHHCSFISPGLPRLHRMSKIIRHRFRR